MQRLNHHDSLAQQLLVVADRPDAPGLRLVTFELSGGEALQALEGRLASSDGDGLALERRPGRIVVSDPDGERLAFIARGAAGA